MSPFLDGLLHAASGDFRSFLTAWRAAAAARDRTGVLLRCNAHDCRRAGASLCSALGAIAAEWIVIAARYHRMIDWIGDGTGLPDTILHIHAGLALLMLARLVTRRSFGTFIPWSVVVAGEAFNEIMDRLNFGSWRWEDTLLDIANTLFWPTMICLGVRLRPLIIRDRPPLEADRPA